MLDYDRTAQAIHDNAAAKGFWESDRNYGEMLALMHSELSEALEEHRAGRPAFYTVHEDYVTERGEATWTLERGKPEGAAVELADCIIRALDTMHSQVPGTVTEHVTTPELEMGVPEHPENFGHALAFAHTILSRSYDAHYTPSPFDSECADALMLGALIQWCEAMIEDMGLDVEAVVYAKMAYNATREHKHGKAY